MRRTVGRVRRRPVGLLEPRLHGGDVDGRRRLGGAGGLGAAAAARLERRRGRVAARPRRTCGGRAAAAAARRAAGVPVRPRVAPAGHPAVSGLPGGRRSPARPSPAAAAHAALRADAGGRRAVPSPGRRVALGPLPVAGRRALDVQDGPAADRRAEWVVFAGDRRRARLLSTRLPARLAPSRLLGARDLRLDDEPLRRRRRRRSWTEQRREYSAELAAASRERLPPSPPAPAAALAGSGSALFDAGLFVAQSSAAEFRRRAGPGCGVRRSETKEPDPEATLAAGRRVGSTRAPAERRAPGGRSPTGRGEPRLPHLRRRIVLRLDGVGAAPAVDRGPRRSTSRVESG